MEDTRSLVLKVKLHPFIDGIGFGTNHITVRVKQPPKGWRELLDAQVIPLGFDKPTAFSHDERTYTRTVL